MRVVSNHMIVYINTWLVSHLPNDKKDSQTKQKQTDATTAKAWFMNVNDVPRRSPSSSKWLADDLINIHDVHLRRSGIRNAVKLTVTSGSAVYICGSMWTVVLNDLKYITHARIYRLSLSYICRGLWQRKRHRCKVHSVILWNKPSEEFLMIVFSILGHWWCYSGV